MSIKVGDKIPMTGFKVMGEDGPELLSAEDLFTNKKVVLFGVPGAFTPTCHNSHLPGFLDNYDLLISKGIDAIGVVSVNDVWVMNEWAKASKAEGKIHFLSDGAIEFTKAIGMEVDLGVASLGIRSQRYSMIVENEVVTLLNIEEAKSSAEISGAAAILTALG